jgi:hypothetical protein
MERLELMIDEARTLSQNEKYDADSGVSQQVFVRYFKNAQDAIVREIVNTKSKFLLKDILYTSVNGQELYPWPKDIYLQNVDTMEYSDNGTDFVFLERVYTKDRADNFVGWAFGYSPRNDGFILVPPVIGGGKLRINYIRNLPSPQVRAGRISSVTVTGDQITAMTLDPAQSSFNPDLLNSKQSLCVVSSRGEKKVIGVQIDSIDGLTGVVTFSPHTLLDGETVVNGDYVCAGELVTNKIELPDICDSFLIEHVVFQAKYGDSSRWTTEAKDMMRSHLAQLIESFSKNTDDINEVIITNYDYLT